MERDDCDWSPPAGIRFRFLVRLAMRACVTLTLGGGGKALSRLAPAVRLNTRTASDRSAGGGCIG